MVHCIPRLRSSPNLLERPPSQLPSQLGDLHRRRVGRRPGPHRHSHLGQRRQGLQARRRLPRQRPRPRVDHVQDHRVHRVHAADAVRVQRRRQGRRRQVRLLHHARREPGRLRLHPDHGPPVAQEPADRQRQLVRRP